MACRDLMLSLHVCAEANNPTRSSMVMFGWPAGVGHQEEPAIFVRHLPVGVKSLSLDAACWCLDCPVTHYAILEVLMDTVTVATYYGFIVDLTRGDLTYWTVGSSTLPELSCTD